MSLIKRILWYFKPLKTTVANISITAPSRKLAGKRVIVTGGTRGLGYYIAKRFAAEGGEVLITGRDETKTAIVAKEIGCKYLCLDVTHLESFKGFFPIARKELGGQIDILVNNAGISLHEGNMMNVTVEGFFSQIMTNLTGPYFLAQEFLRQYENQIEKSNASFNHIHGLRERVISRRIAIRADKGCDCESDTRNGSPVGYKRNPSQCPGSWSDSKRHDWI